MFPPNIAVTHISQMAFLENQACSKHWEHTTNKLSKEKRTEWE